MERRGRGRAARSDSQASRVRTRAQAAAEAAAAAPTNNTNNAGPASATRSSASASTSRATRKRTRSSRRGASDSNANAAAPASTASAPAPPNPVERPSKRSRRAGPTVSRGGRNQSTSNRTRGGNSSRSNPSASQSARGRSSITGRGSRSARGRGSHRRSSGNRAAMNDGSDDGRRSGEGPSSLGSNDRSGTAALHGLLRSLGGGFDDMFPIPHASGSRIRNILSALRAPDNTNGHVDALTQLCEYLSVGTEESMVSFSVDAFVPSLVNILKDGTAETKLLSARAITHLMDALPTAASSISHHGASEPLCANLLAIQYIDLAEQSLSALEKLSTDFPHPIVRAGGFSACLTYIDFFSTGVQRVAASTVCNLCRNPPADAMDMIVEVLPTMFQLLDSDDQRIREQAVQGFSRLAEGYRGSSDKLELLCSENEMLIEKILGLVVPTSPPALAPSCYAAAILLLCNLARGSVALSATLMDSNPLIVKMKERLENIGTAHALDFLSLADALLPDTGNPEDVPAPQTRSRRRRSSSGVGSALAAVDTARREALLNDSAPLEKFGNALFQPLMRFCVASADHASRQLALSIMSKFLCIAPAAIVKSLALAETTSDGPSSDISFCPFVATLLSENSTHAESQLGLSLVNSALAKVPEVKNNFVREGVLHELARLTADSNKKSGEIEVNGDSDAQEALGATRSSRRDPSAELRERTLRTPASMGRYSSTPRSAPRSSNPPANARLSLRVSSFRTSQTEGAAQAVAKRALQVVNAHLSTDSEGKPDLSVLKNVVLDDLLSIKHTLSSAGDSDVVMDEDSVLGHLFEKLTAESGVTVFEFSQSRIVDALYDYLLAPSLSGQMRRDRYLELASSLKKLDAKKPFLLLIQRLLGAFSAEEKFHVMVSEASSSSGSGVAPGLRQLSQPFKLKLSRDTGDEGKEDLKDYSAHIVLIEPLATMTSVQDFLWPRVNMENSRRRSLQVSRRLASSSDNGSTGLNLGSDHLDEDMVHSDDNEEVDHDAEHAFDQDEMEGMEGFEHRVFGIDVGSADRMDGTGSAGGEDAPNNEDNSDDEVSSESDEVIERGEMDGAEMDTDGSGLGLDQPHPGSLPPVELDHEVLSSVRMPMRLGSDFEGDPQTRARHASAIARAISNGEMSAAALRTYAAALTGAGRGSHRSHRMGRSPVRTESSVANRTPRLSFSMNNVAIPLDRSILSAVVKSTLVSGGSINSRLWNDVHVLSYSKARNEINSISSDLAAASSSAGASSSSGALRRSTRLKQSSSGSTSVSVVPPATPAPPKPKNSTDCVPESCLDLESTMNDSVLVPETQILNIVDEDIKKYVALLSYLKWMHNESRVASNIASPQFLGDVGMEKDFLCHKITSKVKRQLSDPLVLCAGAVPQWCFELARKTPFLISFETRRILFQSTALGVARALHLLQLREDVANNTNGVSNNSQRSSRRDNEARIGRIQRQKVRIHRSRLLESAVRVMSMYASHTTVLEVEYFDEVGTGLGPTLEFYTMSSREVQRLDLGLWRAKNQTTVPKDVSKEKGSGSSARSRRRSRGSSPKKSSNECEPVESNVSKYAEPSGDGLYPSCLPTKSKAIKTTLDYFTFLGRLVAKALVDGRLLDLRLSPTFCDLLHAYIDVLDKGEAWGSSGNANSNGFHVLGRGDVDNISSKACELNAVEVWEAFCNGRNPLTLMSKVDPQLSNSLQKLLSMLENGQGDMVSDLCLSFTLPGDDTTELIPKGTDQEVDASNLHEYIARVAYHVLYGGVRNQMESFIGGFSEVLDIRSLSIIQSHEMEMLMCGPAHEEWNVEFLVQSTRCDHGFRHDSKAVLILFRVLSEMTPEQQRQFVLFVTGSPALPLGGLGNLNPRLTIVKRTPEGGRLPDECLPTVMTCTNYLKLPDYSNYEVAKERIRYAISEGQGSFHLS